MYPIQILVDDREQAVIPYFETYTFPQNITYKVSRMNYGDYSILYKEKILFLIERKTWRDLSSSIKDGRKHNVDKMLKIRTDTNCILIYLIEGNQPNRNSKISRIPYKNLRSHLDHLAFRDNIHILHSKDKSDTIYRIVEIIQNYLSIKPSPIMDDEYPPAIGGETKLKEPIQTSDSHIISKIWSCIPNITERTATLFINKNYHISDLLLGNISKDEIYSMKYDTCIIGKRSSKIWNLSRIIDSNNKYFIKMLSKINGITKVTADIILKSISFEELLKGNVSIEILEQIKKTKSRTIGKKMATRILFYFTK